MAVKRAPVDKFLDSGYPSGTAARKARFVNALLRFIADDYPEDRFTNQLYEGLYNSGYFGFIAHYDRAGFYYEQLSTPERRTRFLADLRRSCERDRHTDRPDIWSDVKAVLAERLNPSEPQTARAARTARTASGARRAAAPKYDGPTLF